MSKHYCSWCFQLSEQSLLNKKLLGRDLHECATCNQETATCMACSNMCRVYDDGPDKLCYMCKKIIDRWDFDPLEIHKRLLSPELYCSWCFTSANQKLYRSHTITRMDYICTNCSKQTAKCRYCEIGASRNHSNLPDQACAMCKNLIGDWENPYDTGELLTSGWCSWCISNSIFEVEKDHTLRRDYYQCIHCGNRTLKCMAQCGNMARAGAMWNDNFCSKCFGEFERKLKISSWEYLQERRDVIVRQQRDSGRVLAELKRKSKYRDQAIEEGLERPFLLLVSMPPFMRNQIAANLGFCLFVEEYFGDPHAESIHILCDSRVGMQARANQSWETLNPLAHNSNWCDILVRVMQAIFDLDIPVVPYELSKDACKTPSSDIVQKLEEDFIVLLSKRTSFEKKNDEDSREESESEIDDLLEEEERVKHVLCDEVTEQDRIVARGALTHLSTATEELIQRRRRIEESEEGRLLFEEAQFFSEEAVETANTEDKEGDLDLDASITHIKSMIKKNTGMNRDEVTSYGIQLGMQVAGVNKLSAALLVLRLSVQVIPVLAGITLPLVSLLGVFSTPLFFIGCAALAAGAIKLAFGSTEGRLLFPVICILNQRLILAFEDIDIDEVMAGNIKC